MKRAGIVRQAYHSAPIVLPAFGIAPRSGDLGGQFRVEAVLQGEIQLRHCGPRVPLKASHRRVAPNSILCTEI